MDLRWIAFAFLNHIVASQTDPCTTYKTLNDTNFRTDSNSSTNKSPCGLFPPPPWPQWYRFTATPGGAVATQCSQNFWCGATEQIWIKDSLPSYSDGEKSVRTCLKTSDSCCAAGRNITVKTCSGFYVYNLDIVPGCSRYCINATASTPPIISTTTLATTTLQTSLSNSTTVITTSKRTDTPTASTLTFVPSLYITSQQTTMKTTSTGTGDPTSNSTIARSGEDFSTEITPQATDDTTAAQNPFVNSVNNSSHGKGYQTSTSVQTSVSNSNSTPVTNNFKQTVATTTSHGLDLRQSHPPSEHSNTLIAAVVGSVVGLAVLALVVFLLYRKKCRNQKRRQVKSTYVLHDDIPVVKEEGFVEKRKFDVKSIGQQADDTDLAQYNSSEDLH